MSEFLLEDRVYETLNKYVKSRQVEEQDYGILETYSGMGLVLWGYTTVEENGDKIDAPVAKLSPLARRLVQREKIWRNPFSRFFYNVFSSI